MMQGNSGHLGSSIVTRRGIEESQTNSYAGLWIYPEIMDIIALVAALCLGLATTAMFSFSYEEILPANQRFIDDHEARGVDSFWVGLDPENPVFRGMMMFTSVCACFSALALILAVATRIILTYIINMKKSARKRHFLLQWVNPLSVLVVCVWMISVILTAPAMYFMAWVVFPPEVANSDFLVTLGACFMIVTFVFFLMAVFLAMRARRIGSQEMAEKENAKTAAAASTAAANNYEYRRDGVNVQVESESEHKIASEIESSQRPEQQLVRRTKQSNGVHSDDLSI